MSRDEVLKDYEVKDGRIVSPGKFEGEPVFAPVFWQMGLEGFSDGDDGKVYSFRFAFSGRRGNPQDEALLKEWPELGKWLGRKRSLKMYEDSQGFVRCY